MAEKKLSVVYVGDDSSLKRTIGDIDKAHSGLGSKIKSIGSGIVSAAKYGAVGLAALGGAAVYAFGQFEDAEKVAGQTDAVLKSTGHSANITAEAVENLAGAISRKTGIDDEAIQSGENMLLTFKNIRNEAGAGNDIFNQSTRVLTDMATAMGSEPQQAAIQLGKALNDPIAGISALSRVGVTFTDQQKEQIATLVESGNTMAAQKIILHELTSEFGGSAAAQATSSDKMKVALGNLAEMVGGAVAPLLTILAEKAADVANWLGEHAAPAAQKLWTFLQALWATIQPAIATILPALGEAVGAIADWFAKIWPTVQKVAKVIGGALSEALQAAWAMISEHLWPSLKQLYEALQPIIKVVATVIGVVVVLTLKALPPLIKVLGFVVDIIADVVSAVAGVIEWFGKMVGKVADFVGNIRGKIADGIHAIAETWRAVWGNVRDFFSGVWQAIGSAASSVLNGIISLINGVIGGINVMIRGFNSIPFVPNIPEVPGIPHLARGAADFMGGLALVGERGPELVGLPRHSSVMPAGQTARALGGGITIVINAGSIIAERDLMAKVREAAQLGAARNAGRTGF